MTKTEWRQKIQDLRPTLRHGALRICSCVSSLLTLTPILRGKFGDEKKMRKIRSNDNYQKFAYQETILLGIGESDASQ